VLVVVDGVVHVGVLFDYLLGVVYGEWCLGGEFFE